MIHFGESCHMYCFYTARDARNTFTSTTVYLSTVRTVRYGVRVCDRTVRKLNRTKTTYVRKYVRTYVHTYVRTVLPLNTGKTDFHF